MQARSNLKRQLAAQGQSGAAGAIRSDAMGVVRSIWQEDGPFGFWKGERGKAVEGESDSRWWSCTAGWQLCLQILHGRPAQQRYGVAESCC